MDYKGNKCISCGEKFADGDDIVVCPDCGTPYHRECYKKEGKCINTELHEKNESWKPEVKEKAEENKSSVCSKCGTENKDTSLYCENCGEALQPENKIYNAEGKIVNHDNSEYISKINQMNETLQKNICDAMHIGDEEIDGVKMYEMAYFIRSNIQYYLTAFKRFKETGKKFSINFLCFLIPYYYFANRKMYLWALISFLVITLLSIPSMIEILATGQLISMSAAITENSIFNALLNVSNFMIIAFKLIMSFTANWLYCRHTVKSVKNIKSSYPNNEWTYTMMKKGGTSIGAMLITMIIEIAVMLGIMSLISFIFLFI